MPRACRRVVRPESASFRQREQHYAVVGLVRNNRQVRRRIDGGGKRRRTAQGQRRSRLERPRVDYRNRVAGGIHRKNAACLKITGDRSWINTDAERGRHTTCRVVRGNRVRLARGYVKQRRDRKSV